MKARRSWIAAAVALSLGLGSARAEAADAVRVEVIILEVGRGEGPGIDAQLRGEAQLLQMLPQYDQLRVIARLDRPVEVGSELALAFETPSRTKAKLSVQLLEQSASSMKLRVRCKSLQDLDTTTTHKDGGMFLVVRPQSKVGIAIRRKPS